MALAVKDRGPGGGTPEAHEFLAISVPIETDEHRVRKMRRR